MEWTDKHGKKTPIDKLGDRHLKNIYEMLLRAGQRELSNAVASAYTGLGFLRGEYAIMTLESELWSLEDMTPREFALQKWPIFEHIESEMGRRGFLK